MPSVFDEFKKRITPTLLLAGAQKAGIKLVSISGEWWQGWCPDHALFKGALPSHPKWGLNSITGGTFCFTEGRGSHILLVIRDMLGGKVPLNQICEEYFGIIVDDDGSAQYQGGVDKAEAYMRAAKQERSRLEEQKSSKEAKIRALLDVWKDNWEEVGWVGDVQSPEAITWLRDGKAGGPAKVLLSKKEVVRVGGTEYDGRIWFPMRKIDGSLAGINGLLYVDAKNDPTSRKSLKYIYPNASGIWGLDGLKKGLKCLLITEGIRDALIVRLLGSKYGIDAIAANAASLNSDGVKDLLRARVKFGDFTTCLCMDGDDAGQMGAKKTRHLLLSTFDDRQAKILNYVLPEGIDPKNMRACPELWEELKGFIFEKVPACSESDTSNTNLEITQNDGTEHSH